MKRMKSLKNSFNIHPKEKASGKEFSQLLYALEKREEFGVCIGYFSSCSNCGTH